VLQSQQIEHVVFYPGDNSPAPASWMLNAKQERKEHPKAMEERTIAKNLQEYLCIMDA
jgi:hypothetical protein